jgi:hypothetical protein
MTEEARNDFPAISNGQTQQVGQPLGQATFGDTVLQGETLFEDIGGDWRNGEWGQEIGTVTLKHYPTTVRDKILLRAWFVFNDGDTVEYGGLVPGGSKWQGKGRLGFRGGSGKFANRGDELDVESSNPKRWG